MPILVPEPQRSLQLGVAQRQPQQCPDFDPRYSLGPGQAMIQN